MTRSLLAVALFISLAACDSAVSPPTLEVEFVAPDALAEFRPGETVALRIEIISALDIRDGDLFFTARNDTEGVQELFTGLEIKQGAAMTKFVIEADLALPDFPEDANVNLVLYSPSGTRNRIAVTSFRR